mgnify:CR=1 FL=1
MKANYLNESILFRKHDLFIVFCLYSLTPKTLVDSILWIHEITAFSFF